MQIVGNDPDGEDDTADLYGFMNIAGLAVVNAETNARGNDLPGNGFNNGSLRCFGKVMVLHIILDSIPEAFQE